MTPLEAYAVTLLLLGVMTLGACAVASQFALARAVARNADALEALANAVIPDPADDEVRRDEPPF